MTPPRTTIPDDIELALEVDLFVAAGSGPLKVSSSLILFDPYLWFGLWEVVVADGTYDS